MDFEINESLKYKQNINFGESYFIIPNDIDIEKATQSDLVLVKATGFGNGFNVAPDYFPNGIILTGQKAKYNEKGEYEPEILSGIAVYESINGTNTIKTNNGIYIRHSYSTPQKTVKFEFVPLESVKNKYILKYIFSVSKHIKLSITVSGDVFFNSKDEAEKFSHFLTFYGGEFNINGLMIVVNERCIHYSHYDIFIDDNPYEATHEELFDYLSSICSEDLKKMPEYIRSFRLEPNWYEIVQI